MSFSNCGQYLVSGGKDRRLCLWYNRKNNDEEDNFILVSAVDTGKMVHPKTCFILTSRKDITTLSLIRYF